MGERGQYVVFELAELKLALHLSAVERVVWAAQVTPLPEAPDAVPGLVNVAGDILPVVDIRPRFGLHGREMGLGDQFIIVNTARRRVVLWVDVVTGVIEPAEDEVVPGDAILPGLDTVEGAVKLPDGLVLIHDLDRFLSGEEERILAAAEERAGHEQGATDG